MGKFLSAFDLSAPKARRQDVNRCPFYFNEVEGMTGPEFLYVLA
jgi:hypothetical protein